MQNENSQVLLTLGIHIVISGVFSVNDLNLM